MRLQVDTSPATRLTLIFGHYHRDLKDWQWTLAKTSPKANAKLHNDTHPAEVDEASLARKGVQPKLNWAPTLSGRLPQCGELTQATSPRLLWHRSYEDEAEATKSAGPGAVAQRSQGADLTSLLQEQQTEFRQRWNMVMQSQRSPSDLSLFNMCG